MNDVYDHILDYVGNTPLIRLHSVTGDLKATVYAKVEMLNPGASVKDRIAMKIIEDAEADGSLQPGGTIVEATSGNTGAGLAMAAAVKGYKCVFVLPDKQSEEKRAALRAYGARVVVTPTNVEPDDPQSYYSVAKRIADETPGAFYANQYHNPSNPKAHELSTGPELYAQLDGRIDAFVAGLGTGGTLTGVGRYFKAQDPKIQLVGVDPVGSLYYDWFKVQRMTRPYGYILEGIGEDFLPTTMDFSNVDDLVRVHDTECFQMTRRLAQEEGLFVGGSCGAAVAGALRWVRDHDREGLVVVVLLPDSGSRYLSKIYSEAWMESHRYLEPIPELGTLKDFMATGACHEGALAHDLDAADALDQMRAQGRASMPIAQHGEIFGVVHERDLGQASTLGVTKGTPLSGHAADDYCTVAPGDDLILVSELLTKYSLAVICDGKNVLGSVCAEDLNNDEGAGDE